MIETWAFFVILYVSPDHFGMVAHGPFRSEGECKHALSEVVVERVDLLYMTPCLILPKRKDI